MTADFGLTEWRTTNAIAREVPRLTYEVEGIEFGDECLTKRLVRIVQTLGSRPHDSIPAAMATRGEMEATYRFFANGKVTPDAILSKHFECSLRRCSEQPVALLIQDTTEVDLTRLTEQVAGAGPLDDNHRFGAFVHPLLAMDMGGVPLGFVWATMWTRTPEQQQLSRKEKARRRKYASMEEKESMRWLDGIRQVRRVAEECPDTTCVCIADSEADIFELFAEPRDTTHGRPLELLIRAAQDRVDANSGAGILETVKQTPVLYECVVDLSPRRPKTNAETRRRKTSRGARVATVQVGATTVTIQAPWRPAGKLTNQTLNVVLVEEVNAPDGEEPLQWILLTTLPIGTSDDVRQIVSWYCQRRGIEVCFRTLKSGCRIEERQFEYLNRELNFIAVSMIHAWRVLLLCRLGRECPDMSCDVVFEASEWKAVYMHPVLENHQRFARDGRSEKIPRNYSRPALPQSQVLARSSNPDEPDCVTKGDVPGESIERQQDREGAAAPIVVDRSAVQRMNLSGTLRPPARNIPSTRCRPSHGCGLVVNEMPERQGETSHLQLFRNIFENFFRKESPLA